MLCRLSEFASAIMSTGFLFIRNLSEAHTLFGWSGCSAGVSSAQHFSVQSAGIVVGKIFYSHTFLLLSTPFVTIWFAVFHFCFQLSSSGDFLVFHGGTANFLSFIWNKPTIKKSVIKGWMNKNKCLQEKERFRQLGFKPYQRLPSQRVQPATISPLLRIGIALFPDAQFSVLKQGKLQELKYDHNNTNLQRSNLKNNHRHASCAKRDTKKRNSNADKPSPVLWPTQESAGVTHLGFTAFVPFKMQHSSTSLVLVFSEKFGWKFSVICCLIIKVN